jgi:hypothetical protein
MANGAYPMKGAKTSGTEQKEEDSENRMRKDGTIDIVTSRNSSTDTIDRLVDDKGQPTIRTSSRGKFSDLKDPFFSNLRSAMLTLTTHQTPKKLLSPPQQHTQTAKMARTRKKKAPSPGAPSPAKANLPCSSALACPSP